MRQLFTRMLLLLLFITPVMTLARPLIEEGGQWTNLTVKNFFPNSKKLQYIFQVQNRLNTRNNVFDSTFIRGALDYTVNPSINIWVGYDFRYIYNETNNRLEYEQRFWQQFLWTPIRHNHLEIALRTRFEQIDDLDEHGLNLQVRQKFILKFTNTIRDRVTPVISDEMFFNLNHPVWVSPDTLEQNRLFLGFEIPNAKNTFVWSIGYLNQLVLTTPRNVMNHVLFLSFTFF